MANVSGKFFEFISTLYALSLLTFSCEPNFCSTLNEEKCIESISFHPPPVPDDLLNEYQCDSFFYEISLISVRSGHFVRDEFATLHGLYQDYIFPDISYYPACFYKKMGIKSIIVAQGILRGPLEILGRSSNKRGIIQCSVYDFRRTFHHEMFHVMNRRKFVNYKNEEKMAERYAELVDDYLSSTPRMIPIQHILNNLEPKD